MNVRYYRNMKKLIALLLAVLLLCPAASAFAEGGVEIAVVDGIPVVVESVGFETGDTATFNTIRDMVMTLPSFLVSIEEEAFAGILAQRVEISENVAVIGARAFADCLNLRELVIPPSVTVIDDSALEGSGHVTIYGELDSEAQRFAVDNGIPFVATNPEAIHAPVILPYIDLDWDEFDEELEAELG